MINPITNLSTYVRAIGKAYVYANADPTVAAGWQLMGITEGDIVVDEKFKYNDYTLPEWTGDAIHNRELDGQDIHISMPTIWGAPALYAQLSPTGASGGGRSRPFSVMSSLKTVAIIPLNEVGTGVSNGTPVAGSGTVTVGALGAATFTTTQAATLVVGAIVVIAGVGYSVATFNGTTGATLTGAPAVATAAFSIVTYTPAALQHAIWLHKASFEPGQYNFKHGDGGKIIRSVGCRPLFDATKPEGQMLYTIGAPELSGITTYRL